MDFEKLHREESGRILAILIGLLGDFDLAEEMLQEAYAVALQRWPSDGTPANPRAWLISTARHKAIDRLRRDQRFERKSEEIAKTAEIAARPESDREEEMFADDRLRLYDALLRTHASPVIEVNRAVAVAMARSLEEGLALLDELETRAGLKEFHLLPAARADLLRRLGRMGKAADAYRRALSLATNDIERRFLRRRMVELEKLRDSRS